MEDMGNYGYTLFRTMPAFLTINLRLYLFISKNQGS